MATALAGFSDDQIYTEAQRRIASVQAVTFGGGGSAIGGGLLQGALAKLLETLLSKIDLNALLSSLLQKWLGGTTTPPAP